MTSAQKAVETRRKNKEKRIRKAQEEKLMRETMKRTLLEILNDEKCTAEQKLEASAMLIKLI